MIQVKLKSYSFYGGQNSWICYELLCGCMLYEYKKGKIEFIPCKLRHEKLSDIMQFKVINNEQKMEIKQ